MAAQNPFDGSPFVANAMNIPQNDNPPYTFNDFFTLQPQFHGHITNEMVNHFIGIAQNTVLEVRWHSFWQLGMSLFIAHFCTLFMRASGGPDPTAESVISAAGVTGLMTSEGAGDLSYSQDVSAITDGLKGWANWNSTAYGVQFATLAKMLGKAGMYFV